MSQLILAEQHDESGRSLPPWRSENITELPGDCEPKSPWK
jgi:hypothetical protein